MDVTSDSPALIAGLKEGDNIISINNEPIASVDDIRRRLTRDVIGKELAIAVLRNWAIAELVIVTTENLD